jgi:acetate kinase
VVTLGVMELLTRRLGDVGYFRPVIRSRDEPDPRTELVRARYGLGEPREDLDQAASLALEVYAYRIRKYVGAYAAALGRLDDLVFTAGIGENAAGMRARVVEGLELLGLRIDPDRNAGADVRSVPGGVVDLHPEGAEVAVLAIATDEEREIAAQSLAASRRA